MCCVFVCISFFFRFIWHALDNQNKRQMNTIFKFEIQYTHSSNKKLQPHFHSISYTVKMCVQEPRGR